MEKEKMQTTFSLSETFRQFEKSLGFKNEIKWINVILISVYHIVGVYWCYYYAFPVKWQSVVFASFMYVISGLGVTGGAHRLWTHRAYKAKLPMKIILLIFFSTAGQNSMVQWVRDHRVHHKFSDTEADPHNSHRGLFFSHIGWLLTKKNAEVLRRGKEVDMSDILNDPLLQWHERHFVILKILLCWFFPTMMGIWLWDENWKTAVAWQWFIRYISVFHSELTVNSLAHAYGYKSYNKNIKAAENRFVATCSLGEGWHNYHHAFPFDYKAAEHYDILNFTTKWIQFCSYVGWATDLKEATPQMINGIAERLGDGTPVHFPIELEGDISDARDFTSGDPVLCEYSLGGCSVARVHEVRDLGVLFDAQLTFRPHVQQLTAKAFQRLCFVLRNAAPLTLACSVRGLSEEHSGNECSGLVSA